MTSQGELSPIRTPSPKASIFHSNIGKNLSQSIRRQWSRIKNISDTQKDSKSQHIVTVASENDAPNVSAMNNYDKHSRISLHDADVSVLPVDINSADTNIVTPKTTSI